MAVPHQAALPIWTMATPIAASVLVALKLAHVVPSAATPVLLAAAALLLGCVFAAVHHAELLVQGVRESVRDRFRQGRHGDGASDKLRVRCERLARSIPFMEPERSEAMVAGRFQG